MPFRPREQFIESDDLGMGQVSTEELEAVDFVVDRAACGAFELALRSYDQVGARLSDECASPSAGAVIRELLDVLA